jgi:hypothetical protein
MSCSGAIGNIKVLACVTCLEVITRVDDSSDGKASAGSGRRIQALLYAYRKLIAFGRQVMGEHPVEVWHRLVGAGDPSGLNDFLAEDAVFYSPVVHSAQRGKKLTTLYLTAALRLFFNPTFRYVREIVGAADAMLEFETEIDGVIVNGVDIFKWNEAGQVVEFKVMLRPLKAVSLIHQRMAALPEAY